MAAGASVSRASSAAMTILSSDQAPGSGHDAKASVIRNRFSVRVCSDGGLTLIAPVISRLSSRKAANGVIAIPAYHTRLFAFSGPRRTPHSSSNTTVSSTATPM